MRAASVSDNGAAEEKKKVATVSGVVIRNKNYEQCTQPTEWTVKTKINTHTRQFEKNNTNTCLEILTIPSKSSYASWKNDDSSNNGGEKT